MPERTNQTAGTSVTLGLSDDVLRVIAERVATILKSNDEPEDRYLDVAGAAAYLGCKVSRIYDLTSLRESTGFPVRKDGTRSFFLKSELDAWARSR